VFGHKWESARGTVVETLIEQATVDGMPGLHRVPVYVLDVREPNGEQVRASVKGVPGMSTDLAAGTLVTVEVNAKTGEFRFSPDHIKASRGGPGGSVGFSSPEAPSTFDPVTPAMPAATFSSPADVFGTPTSSVGTPGGSVSFSSPPVPPPSFGPATPADTGRGSFSTGSFSAGSFSGGSFGSGGSFSSGGEDGKADRIARIADQRDHGQLTEQQFQAQRQQIMDEI
jgi:hypothetical protein